ncbi:hypothetical protein N7466_003005 [Penicillium verhagenii]|uniref:uncharacterized protein n=1 Tax=Penicillium verhagenii TaxID=1562060 RepID=UPI0025451CCF|nr:uncharacterized protein N7466_003005 [Penicillium verhagenii]KAJ5936555.1 hypothetical protein N7466_003005 [Penicillium verhagenii]
MASMQIVSDLHLEKPAAYDIFQIPPQAPFLALLGDIGAVTDEGFFLFVEQQLRNFKIVFLLLGNHEPYHSTWKQTKAKIWEFSASLNQRHSQDNSSGTFVFLDQTRYDLAANVTILGCTLFSKVSEQHRDGVSMGLNDFYYINDWTVEDHTAAHEADLKWLNDQVALIADREPHRKIIIFTHHSPLGGDLRAADPRHIHSPLSSGFATDLSLEECWKNARVSLWAYGHTHYNIDFTDKATQKLVLSNQRGYYFSQSQRFDVEKVVHIDNI